MSKLFLIIQIGRLRQILIAARLKECFNWARRRLVLAHVTSLKIR